jgi:hypothetical protein
MGRLVCAMTCIVLTTATAIEAAEKPDALVEARRLYNQRRFQEAVSNAEQARLAPDRADSADLVAARAYLERFRESGASDDLTNARERLRRLRPQRFDAAERLEFLVGLGEALYFDQSYGAAANMFASVLDGSTNVADDSHDRILDWWATAIERDYRLRPEAERHSAYDRIRARMQDEIVVRPGSTTASYWLVAAARGRGDLQGAWDAAEEGWVRAAFARDRGEALRADLDRLMLQGIIPERAKVLSQSADALRLQWETFKEKWKAA